MAFCVVPNRADDFFRLVSTGKVHQHERIEVKLASLGARIERREDEEGV